MGRNSLLALAAFAAAVTIAACSDGPDANALRDSFAQQLAANSFVKDYQRNGDKITFTAPGAEGGTAKWRISIDSAIVEENNDPALPYKGTVKSSWHSDGQLIVPKGTESHLPTELLANGLSQDCWAFWNEATKRWEWE